MPLRTSQTTDAVAPVPDDVLMRRLAQGDAAALRPLMERYGGKVLNMAYRIVGDRGAAEDLTQETFLRVLDQAARFRRSGGSAQPWILTIGRNLALKHLRRRALEARARPVPERASVDPSRELEQHELGERIQGALDGIDEPFRSALVLCAFEQLSYQEAAAIQSVSVKTLSSRLARARARFRDLLAPYLGGGRAEL